MGIKKYQTEVSPGNFKQFYLVIAEGINKYTGKRVQKKKRGITSLQRAERIYRELWSLCREERPDGPLIRTWGELRLEFFEHIENSIRSPSMPSGLSPQVVRTKKSRFVHLKEWDDRHLDLVTPHLVTTELDQLEFNRIASRPLTAAIQKEIKCMFSFAVNRGILPAHPLLELKKRKVPKKKKLALNHQEVDLLLKKARLENHPYFYIWLLTLTLGLRRSELAGLKWIDVDFEHRLIHVQRQLMPKEGLIEALKSGEDRVVAIPLNVISSLKELRLISKTEFIIDVDCRKWRNGNQSQVLKSFCQKIGIKEVTHHQLRATHITLALIDGVPLGIVKENVGHAKLSTTDVYFRSSGIQMSGQTDNLKINVPSRGEGKIRRLKAVE